MKVKDNRLQTIGRAVTARLLASCFHRVQLSTSLFAIADRIVRAERNLLAARKQEFLAALHQVLLVERPRIHEVLQHDHKHVLRDVADGKALGQAAGLAGDGKLLRRFLRTGNRRGRPQTFERLFDLQTEIRHNAVGDVVEVVVYIHNARERRDLFAVNECVGNGVTRGKTARNRNEVAGNELAGGLLLNQPNDIRYGHPLHRVVMHVTAGVECGLKVDAPNGWMLDGKLDDPANLMVIHTSFNGGHERDIQANGSQPIKSKQLFLKDVGLAANDAVCLAVKAVELEIDRGAHLSELVEEAVIVRNTLAIGVDHDERDATGTGSFHKVDDLRMDGGLAAGELHHFGVPLGANKIVQHRLDLFHRQAEARPRIRKAERTIHVAGAVDFNDAQASVLLMVWTKATIVRATVFDLCSISKRNRARLVELAEIRVGLRIPVDKRLEGATIGTALGHVDFVVAQQNFRIDYPPALRTDAAGEFIEYVVRVLLQLPAG